MPSGLMGAMAVVVPGVDVEDVASVGVVPDQHVIEEFTLQCPDDSLAVRVHPRGPRGGLQGFDSLSFEDRVEGFGVLAVPVADHKAQRLEAHAHLKSEVAGLLGRPLRSRMSGDAGDVEAARAVLEEDQRLDPAKACQVDVREVAGDDGLGLGCQELAPCRPAAAGSRVDTGCRQDLPDCGGSDLVAQPGEFPLDPAAASTRVLACQP